jgi:hypothetical protein
MKKSLLFIAMAILISSIVFGQLAEKRSKDSALIIKLENDWSKALVKRDGKVFERLLANDFFYTENEKLYSRGEVMESVMSKADTVESAYNEDMQVHIKDKTAIMTGWLFVIGKSSGTGFKRKYRFTDIWHNKNGRWQLIAAQDYLAP